MFCLISNWAQTSLAKWLVNLVSRSEMILVGIPTKGKTLSLYSLASSSAFMVSLQGIKITPLVQSWSVIVRIESYPFDTGSFTIRSIATVWKGLASSSGGIGYSDGLLCLVRILCLTCGASSDVFFDKFMHSWPPVLF